ncbi:MAG TPA: hypothetical protein VLB84_05700 [Bacteroidia bacterium]|jgi:hypothetical protein|nr:hypothetical protein [Bacteroidia bacterium]
MSFVNEEKPIVSVKKKNLLPLIEYCIENKIDFTLLSRSSSDDFDVEFIITNPKIAIALGMCLKELKLELNGLHVTPVAAIKAGKKAAAPVTKDATAANGSSNGHGIVAEGDVTLAFDDALQFDLGASN